MRYDLSPNDAAEILGVHVDTVKRWAGDGTLPAMKTPGGWWRFSRSDIDTFIDEHTTRRTEAPA